MTKSDFVEGQDFYYNEDGFMVLTSYFLKKRGFCCKSGCSHCPYGFNIDKINNQKEDFKNETNQK